LRKFKSLGLFFILIGIIIISYTFYAKYKTTQSQDKLLKNYTQQIKNYKEEAKSTKSNNKDNTSYNIKSGTIGILIIPKIDLEVTIGEGTDMDTLRYAVGHFKDTAMPGENGNFALAGHRSYTYGQYFNRLDEVKIGDTIIVKTINGTYKYKVYNTKVVLPEQVDVLNATKTPTMTLITCTPIRIATHRLIISAKLY
jgi:sortase A